MNNITLSFIKFLRELKTYVYFNPTTNVTDLEINSVNDIAGIDTTFTVNGLDSSIDKDFMVNRYVKYNDMYIRIVDYDSATYLVTLESSFGVSILNTDSLFITVKDNIYVSFEDETPLKSQIGYANDYTLLAIIYMQNIMDFDKSKINKLRQDLNSLCAKKRLNFKVYDFDSSSPTYGNEIANAQIKNMPEYRDISYLKSKDIANGYVEYKSPFEIYYREKY